VRGESWDGNNERESQAPLTQTSTGWHLLKKIMRKKFISNWFLFLKKIAEIHLRASVI
jgi:hypothetical protein